MKKHKNSNVKAIIFSSLGAIAAIGSVGSYVANPTEQGKDGTDGNAWYCGTTNVVELTIGKNGDFYYDTDDYNLYQKENNEWVLKIEGFGKKGEQGIQGEQGLKGDTGDQGIQGEQGLKGDTGDQGIQGLKGDTGDQGIKGADGEKGGTGDKGEQGDQGNPGSNGTNGTDGTSSYVWVKYSNTYPTANADMLDSASNFIGIYTGTSKTAPTDYTSYTWLEIKGVKGDKGDTGATGDNGDNGKDGNSVYIGYDGYAWNARYRTPYKITDLDSKCAENTLELYTHNYFDISLVDTTSKQIFLTGEYYSNIKKTIYDEVTLDKITLYVNQSGYLQIGKISLLNGDVSDLIKYPVVEGLNVIDLSDVTIGTNQTIVFGGNETTVQLYKADGLSDTTDTYGNFTVIENFFQVYNSKTGPYCDKLICKVDITSSTRQVSTSYFSNATTVGCKISSMSEVSTKSYPYRYKNNYFGGKTITEIGIPVIKSYSGEMDLYIVKNNELNRRDTYVRKITFTLNCAKNSTINDWVYTDLTSYNIVLEDDETLAFGYVTGGVSWGYCRNTGFSSEDVDRYEFLDNGLTEISTGNAILFDVKYLDTKAMTDVSEIRKLLEKENAEGE